MLPLRAGSPSGPSPPNAAPPPSLPQSPGQLRPPDCGRERLASFVGAENARNACNQRLATLGEPHHGILSRVRCIAWFGVVFIRNTLRKKGPGKQLPRLSPATNTASAHSGENACPNLMRPCRSKAQRTSKQRHTPRRDQRRAQHQYRAGDTKATPHSRQLGAARRETNAANAMLGSRTPPTETATPSSVALLPAYL